MQPFSLTVDKFLEHAARWFPDQEVVEGAKGDVAGQRSYAAIRERSNRLSGALAALGMKPGERVGTMAWNTLDHFEIYYGAMASGLVCHTLNPRLTPEQLTAMIDEAEDRVIAVSADLVDTLTEAMASCGSVEHLIILDAGLDVSPIPGVQIWSLASLLDRHGEPVAWGAFPEEAPAGLCYTSGTTGRPKGVLYTHRSNYLHTLRLLQADAMALTHRDVVLVAVPMFHANGWGLPFAAPAVGAKVVLPGRHLDGASLVRLLRDEGVTVAVGIHTVWLAVADELERSGETLPALQRVIIGGSSCPEALIRRIEERLGARVQASWGMTELSPLGTIQPPNADAAPGTAGRAPLGLDFKLTDASGEPLAQQRNTLGHLRVRGASVVDGYFNDPTQVLDAEGYFDTGDLAVIDDAGNLTISGRSKDLIKSGGEWINPAEIEAIIGQDPAVGLVAVIGRPHDKWGERPLLVVEPVSGASFEEKKLLATLNGKVATWWIPDEVIRVAKMPLAASGKIDKAQLAADLNAGKLLAAAVAS